MTYKEYREKWDKKVNALPIFYAFSNEQFEKAMNERGLTVDDTDKIYRLGNTGGYYLKTDADKIRACFGKNRHKELMNLMENEDGFAYEAFEYEMYNHEYPINWQGDYDVCFCFGPCEYAEDKDGTDYLTDIGYSQKVINEYKRAAKKVYNAMDW